MTQSLDGLKDKKCIYKENNKIRRWAFIWSCGSTGAKHKTKDETTEGNVATLRM